MSDIATTRTALALAVGANLPVLLWGAPGTGKTSAVLALAARLGLPVEVVIGSIREPSDFSGLPVIRDEETRFAPPQWARRLAAAGSGLLFLDELTTAPPAVQAAMLRVVLERAVGDLALPREVRIVAAANPPGIAADGWELSAPLANRLVHLDWRIAAADVAEGFTRGFTADDGPVHAPAPDQVAGQQSRRFKRKRRIRFATLHNGGVNTFETTLHSSTDEDLLCVPGICLGFQVGELMSL